MIFISFVFLFSIFTIISAKEYGNEIDQYIVACHSTDFICFKKQYQLIRDHVLLGNKLLDIPQYKPFIFQYSDTLTCVKITGVEESELAAIGFNGHNKQFWMSLTMPIRIQQVEWSNKSEFCELPDKDIAPKGPHKGQLMKFSGNATMEVKYPFSLHKKRSQVFMLLEEETIDAIVDIPDLSKYNDGTQLEAKLHERSEWAYEMVKHVDVPEHVVLPYTEQLKNLFGKLPLGRFLLLYPSEKYSELQFSYIDENVPV